MSAAHAGVEWRGHSALRARYTPLRALRLPPCDECSALQHETRGAYGARARAKYTRTLTHRGAPTKPLRLCTQHAQVWRTRDTADNAL